MWSICVCVLLLFPAFMIGSSGQMTGLVTQLGVTASSLAASCAVPIQQMEAVAGTFYNAVERRSCADVNGAQRLSNVTRSADKDLDPDRLVDFYYADWSKTQYYQSYDEKTSTLRMKPATPDLASFCSTEYAGCLADNTCPSFCSLSEQQRFNYSVRNMEMCYLRHVQDMQRYFVDSAAATAANGKATVMATTGWAMTPRGFCSLYPSNDEGFQVVMDGVMEWTLSYAYLADPVHNPSRKLIWTQPYSAIWLNSNVVTALMPIDIRGMFFGHFGADVQISDAVLTKIEGSADVAGSFSFLLFRDGGYVMAAHPLGWQTLFDGVPTAPDATLQLQNTSKMDLTEVMAAVSKQTAHDETVTMFAKLSLHVDGQHKRYIAVTTPIKDTPFSLVSFAPYQPAESPMWAIPLGAVCIIGLMLMASRALEATHGDGSNLQRKPGQTGQYQQLEMGMGSKQQLYRDGAKPNAKVDGWISDARSQLPAYAAAVLASSKA